MIVDRFGKPFANALELPVEEPFRPGTIKPEEDYIEINRLGKKLGIPIPLLFVELMAKDKDGIVTGYYKDRSRTFNRNFYNAVFTALTGVTTSSGTFGAAVLSMKNTAGTTKTIRGDSGTNVAVGYCLQSSASIGTTGIIAGTGTTAESFENSALVTPIAQGTSSGQMSYNAVTAPTPTYNAGTKVWTCVYARIMNNNSGGSITVAETGLYVSCLDSTGVNFTAMTERTLLGATVAVANAGQLTVTYTFTLTFPA